MTVPLIFYTLTFLLILHVSVGFTIAPPSSTRRTRHTPSTFGRSLSSPLRMVTPIGPFCPFRSSAALAVEPSMRKLNTPNFDTDMARIQLDMQMGNEPDPEKLKSVAQGIDDSVDDWQDLILTLSSSEDFQTREHAKITTVHLSDSGQTSDVFGQMMKWQAACMRAQADGGMIPPPPAGIDVMDMMQKAQESGKTPPSMAGMTNAEAITGTPFKGTESAFKSDTVREEYEALCRDHESLIGMGARYQSFDPVGKIAYLDQVEAVEDRWDVFFARFKLMGELDQEFVEQCDGVLKSMGLEEKDFRGLLRRAHDLMRQEAERERIA